MKCWRFVSWRRQEVWFALRNSLCSGSHLVRVGKVHLAGRLFNQNGFAPAIGLELDSSSRWMNSSRTNSKTSKNHWKASHCRNVYYDFRHLCNPYLTLKSPLLSLPGHCVRQHRPSSIVPLNRHAQPPSIAIKIQKPENNINKNVK